MRLKTTLARFFNLRSSTVTGNRALGGASGASGSGGAAFGGGIGDFMGTAILNVNSSTIVANSAQGGGGMFGNGSGGGIAVFQNGRATIAGVNFSANRALGAQSADGGHRQRGRRRSSLCRHHDRIGYARLRLPRCLLGVSTQQLFDRKHGIRRRRDHRRQPAQAAESTSPPGR